MSRKKWERTTYSINARKGPPKRWLVSGQDAEKLLNPRHRDNVRETLIKIIQREHITISH